MLHNSIVKIKIKYKSKYINESLNSFIAFFIILPLFFYSFYTIQFVSKQLHCNKEGNNRINYAIFFKYETNLNSAVKQL